MPENTLKKFIYTESFAGLLLVLGATLALILANSPFSNLYSQFITLKFYIGIGKFELSKPLLLWINDGLMAIFFLLIGLELKREFLEGQLSKPEQIVLPGVGALGGIIVPIGIFYYFAQHDALALHGWAIPAATDIAFALGVLALFSKRVSPSLKIFLLTLAIFDDVAAIIIIALFYAHDISALSLGLSVIVLLILTILNLLKVKSVSTYLVIGLVLWACVLKSGVHATIAGVLLAFTIPLRNGDIHTSPLKTLELKLHSWVAWFILPLFAFINSGIDFSAFHLNDIFSPLSLGIFWGLFVGKQIGIFSFCWVAIKCGFAKLPDHTNWAKFYAVCILCGIGFTMSFFISSLAFQFTGEDFSSMSRLSIILASVTSALLGSLFLSMTKPLKNHI